MDTLPPPQDTSERAMKPDKPTIPLMRSVLTVPVIVQRFVDKAPSSGTDIICLDLEEHKRAGVGG